MQPEGISICIQEATWDFQKARCDSPIRSCVVVHPMQIGVFISAHGFHRPLTETYCLSLSGLIFRVGGTLGSFDTENGGEGQFPFRWEVLL